MYYSEPPHLDRTPGLKPCSTSCLTSSRSWSQLSSQVLHLRSNTCVLNYRLKTHGLFKHRLRAHSQTDVLSLSIFASSRSNFFRVYITCLRKELMHSTMEWIMSLDFSLIWRTLREMFMEAEHCERGICSYALYKLNTFISKKRCCCTKNAFILKSVNSFMSTWRLSLEGYGRYSHKRGTHEHIWNGSTTKVVICEPRGDCVSLTWFCIPRNFMKPHLDQTEMGGQ